MVVVLLAVALVANGCANEPVRETGTPGFRDQDVPVDTSPFRLAEASNRSKGTTIPDGVFERREDVSNTLVPPVTSSTTIPSAPPTTSAGPLVAPGAGEGTTGICGFERTVAPFERLPTKSPAETEALVGSLIEVTLRYAVTAPESARADLLAIVETLGGVRDILAANGWNSRSAAFVNYMAVVGRETQAGDPDSLGARLGRVVAIEQESCG